MKWFKRISVKEYENLIKNKNKMYNITPQFTSVELLNKYRDEDNNINEKIEIDEKLNIQNENLSKAIDKNLNKYLEKKQDTSKYSLLIVLEEGFTIILDENFKKLFGFSNGMINESFTRSDLTPNINRVKYLKIFSNLVNNQNDNEFLSNVFINADVAKLITFNDSNIYKKQKIYENTFNY